MDEHFALLPSCALLAVVVVTTYAYQYFLSTRPKKDKQTCLPPMTLRSAGEVWKIIFSRRAPMGFLDMIRELPDNPPAIRFPICPPGFPTFNIVNDHRLARLILDDPRSTKWATAYQFFDLSAGGDTLISSEGNRAKHARKATAAAFSPENVKRMVDITNCVVDEWMVNVLEPKFVNADEAFDVSNEMCKISCESILQFAFDHKSTKKECQDIARNIQIAFAEFSQRSQLNPLRKLWLTGWMFSEVQEARQATKYLFQICQSILQAHRSKENPNLNTIVHMIDKDPEYDNDGQRVRDMLNFLIGGFDSTAYALAWSLLELARHSDEQVKLREALQECNSREDQHHVPALKHLVRETLRLYPAGALGPVRIVAADVAVPGSPTMVIPAKSICTIPFYVVHRNASCFSNPDKFEPSRWENPSEEMLKCFLPFGCGRRNCPGQALANAEMHVVLAKLLDKYEFSVVEEGRAEYMVILRTVGTFIKARRV